MDLKLVKVSLNDKEQIEKMLEEIKKIDAGKLWQYAGMGSIEKFTNFEDWFSKINKESEGKYLLPNRVPASTYILKDNNTKTVVGMFNIRHDLNDYLLNYGGHIGYSIKPSARLKGYGTEGLKLALEEIKKLGVSKVLITCNTLNDGSSKVIENCGGKLENIITCPKGNIIKRYWIDVI